MFGFVVVLNPKSVKTEEENFGDQVVPKNEVIPTEPPACCDKFTGCCPLSSKFCLAIWAMRWHAMAYA
jgi:hypothetical protein